MQSPQSHFLPTVVALDVGEDVFGGGGSAGDFGTGNGGIGDAGIGAVGITMMVETAAVAKKRPG